MGSLDRYCRLCAQAVRPDQLQPLYCGEPGHTTESQVHDSVQALLVCNGAQAAGRLRSFLGFAVAAGDRLPKQVRSRFYRKDHCGLFRSLISKSK